MQGTLHETYQQQKARHLKELNEFEGIFFAFSNKQFNEGMKKVNVENAKNELYSLGNGGFIRKDKSIAFNEMLSRHNEELQQCLTDDTFLFNALVYELRNHEYCITYDPSDALNVLGLSIGDINVSILRHACSIAIKGDFYEKGV